MSKDKRKKRYNDPSDGDFFSDRHNILEDERSQLNKKRGVIGGGVSLVGLVAGIIYSLNGDLGTVEANLSAVQITSAVSIAELKNDQKHAGQLNEQAFTALDARLSQLGHEIADARRQLQTATHNVASTSGQKRAVIDRTLGELQRDVDDMTRSVEELRRSILRIDNDVRMSKIPGYDKSTMPEPASR